MHIFRKNSLHCFIEGDTYTLTLEPVFKDIQSTFKCHLHYVTPPVLYQLWFYVSVLNTSFETPRMFYTIRSDETGACNVATACFQRCIYVATQRN